MNDHSNPSASTRWAAQFVLYLLLFALLISVGTYLFTADEEATLPAATPTPKPEAPAGATGHDAPK